MIRQGMDPGSQISILGQVSKPLPKRTENVSVATLSNHLKGGVHDPVVFDPFSLNGPKHEPPWPDVPCPNAIGAHKPLKPNVLLDKVIGSPWPVYTKRATTYY